MNLKLFPYFLLSVTTSTNKVGLTRNMTNNAKYGSHEMRLFLYLNGIDEDLKCQENITKYDYLFQP